MNTLEALFHLLDSLPPATRITVRPSGNDVVILTFQTPGRGYTSHAFSRESVGGPRDRSFEEVLKSAASAHCARMNEASSGRVVG